MYHDYAEALVVRGNFTNLNVARSEAATASSHQDQVLICSYVLADF